MQRTRLSGKGRAGCRCEAVRCESKDSVNSRGRKTTTELSRTLLSAWPQKAGIWANVPHRQIELECSPILMAHQNYLDRKTSRKSACKAYVSHLLEEVTERTRGLVDLGAGLESPQGLYHLHPTPILGMYILPTMPTVGAVFKDAALR